MLQEKTELSGGWKLYYEENRRVKHLPSVRCRNDAERLIPHSVDATVPGNFERDLERAGLIPDPYFGMNTLKMQELENLHLWYCKKFRYDGTADENTFIRFEGIDTVAEIYLNGKLMQKVANMFLSYDIPVPELICGENDITVHIIPAVIAARDYDLPASSNALAYNYESLYIRKAASMYGWDIMPRIVSGGIWKPVWLIKKKPERIEDIFLYTNKIHMNGDGITAADASLTVYFTLRTDRDFLRGLVLRVSGSCEGSSFTMQTEVRHTNGRMHTVISAPKLWWPRNTGKANLYDCTAELLYEGTVIDTLKLRTGIRTVALSRTSTTDAEGNGDFCFIVNGRRIFAMGTNWVPMDAFHSNDINRIDRAMEMANDLGCNIIRLWGGNVYECQRFFDICDESGILVWQDFGMGCAVYPQEERFLDILRPEIISVIKANRNHPSLALWAGDNECDAAFSWAGTKRDPNTNMITRRLIPELLRAHDFTRPYIPSSPYIDEKAFESGAHPSEDHLWGPRDYFKGEYYKNTVCHFASETGYHGCPSPRALRTFISEDHLWPIIDDRGIPDKEWLVHASCMRADVSDPYAYRIPLMVDQVKTLFGKMPDDLEDFALMSQISQAEAKKYFIERFRITRGRRNGIIWWNLIDGWPQISDAVVDYTYTKKLAYHFIKRSQAPVLLAFDEPHDDTITLYGINETPDDTEVSYTVTCLTDGTQRCKASGRLEAEKSTPLVTVDIAEGEKKFYLIEWQYRKNGMNVNCKNHYFTNILNIDFKAYRNALEAAGMLEVEGFDSKI